jgi:PAS domain S-box-containing protein
MAEALSFSKQMPYPSPLKASPGLNIPFLEAVGAAIIITDATGIDTYWNSFAEKLYGWTVAEVVGRNIVEITVTPENEQVAQQHMAALNAGNTWSGDFDVRCKSGKLLPALVTLSPLFDESGTVSAIVGISQDLSARREAEKALRTAREELEKRIHERTTELNKANETLHELSARLLQARDEEGRRLARELHDSVGQLLIAVGMNISTVRSQIHKLDEAGARAVTENASLVAQISDEIRTISHLFHPPLLDEAGLASALGWYVDAISERSKIRVEIKVPSELRLPTDMEIAVFRIVQECLTNIHRHSGSKTASISIQQEADHIRVVAQDVGKGIPEHQLRLISDGQSGVGFRGMRERIRYFGGDLKIQSGETGTAITATLPLARV